MISAPWPDQIAAAEWVTARLPLSARTGSDSGDGEDIPLVTLWRDVLGRGDAGAVAEWSAAGGAYWASAPASVDGVLGGYGALHPADAAHSGRLLQRLLREVRVGRRAALDVGAGVGRVSQVRHASVPAISPPSPSFMPVPPPCPPTDGASSCVPIRGCDGA